MISIFGVVVSYEVALLFFSLLVSEVLPFIPNKYNGIVQSAVRILGKFNVRKGKDDRLELVLKRLDDLQDKIDNPVPKDLDKILDAVRKLPTLK